MNYSLVVLLYHYDTLRNCVPVIYGNSLWHFRLLLLGQFRPVSPGESAAASSTHLALCCTRLGDALPRSYGPSSPFFTTQRLPLSSTLLR